MRTVAAGMFMLVLLATQSTSAVAQSAEEVVVAGTVVLRIKVAAGGLSMAERAREIRSRINQALTTEDLTSGNFHLQSAPGGTLIQVGRVVIVTVTAADAQANGTTIRRLADHWLAALREAMPRAKPANRP